MTKVVVSEVMQCIIISVGVFGKISIAAVSLLAQCNKYFVACRNSQKICFYDVRTLICSTVLWNQASYFCYVLLRIIHVGIYVIFHSRYHTLEAESYCYDFRKLRIYPKYARKTSFD